MNIYNPQKTRKRIFLSPPHMGGRELEFVKQAFDANYIAPVGPQLNSFEKAFAEKVGARYAVAVSSCTAALHLVLRYVGVAEGDEVFCSSFTFVASANPILYLGGRPFFVDSDYSSWNMDPQLFVAEIKKRAAINCLPKAVILVHLYGQAADITPIKECCQEYDIVLIEDAAEALGAEYENKSPGTFGTAGIYSFNGNKIITGSSGGMIVSNDRELIEKVTFWATQARDDAAHYEHTEVGYNYRMSNILAAISLGQLQVLDDRVRQKRSIFSQYEKLLSHLPGLEFMPEAGYGKSNRWLTCITVDERRFGCDRESIRLELEKHNIESRPLWKPMHMQPLFRGAAGVGGEVSEDLFTKGLCLPSGTAMAKDDIERIADIVKMCCVG